MEDRNLYSVDLEVQEGSGPTPQSLVIGSSPASGSPWLDYLKTGAHAGQLALLPGQWPPLSAQPSSRYSFWKDLLTLCPGHCPSSAGKPQGAVSYELLVGNEAGGSLQQPVFPQSLQCKHRPLGKVKGRDLVVCRSGRGVQMRFLKDVLFRGTRKSPFQAVGSHLGVSG